MPEKTGISMEVKGMRETQQMLRRLAVAAGRGGGSSALHARYAVIASQWIDRNFQSQGGLVGGWRRLTPLTTGGRRMGTTRILQDTGVLRASFVPKWTENEAIVGTAMEISKYHEFGTRGPYEIRPKRAKALAFKAAGPFSDIRTQRVRTTKVGASFSSLITGRTFKSGLTQAQIMGKKWINPLAYKGEYYVLAKKVIHPGLPQRRMLPREPDLLPQLLKTTLNYLREQERRAG